MKKIITACICVVVGVIGIVVFGIFNLDTIIKTAVNQYGPEVTKTGVGVADVEAAFFSAQARLKDFYLENPEGFKTPRAIQVGAVLLNLDESSLLKETIVIDRIEVEKPEITYEFKGRTNNFKAIMEQMKHPAGSSKGTRNRKNEMDDKGKNLLIRDLVITGGRVNMVTSVLEGEGVAVFLPDIHLQNIGQDEAGRPPEEVFLQIFQAVYGEMTSPELTAEFARQLQKLGIAFEKGEISRQIANTRDHLENVKTEIKGLGDQLKGLFGKE